MTKEIEIKEAIEDIKGIMKEHTVFSNDVGIWEGNPCTCKRCKRLQTLLDLAQSVLDAKMPTERITPYNASEGIKYCNAGYNLALHDFRLWQEKCLGELDIEIEKLFSNHEVYGTSVNERTILSKKIAEKIRNLFGGGEK